MTDADLSIDRLDTGIPRLNRLLGGGILRGSLALFVGASGTGKTLLAQQIVFHQAAMGSSALYLTAYSETHDKLLRHSRTLSFFQPELIGSRVQFVSLVDVLRSGAVYTEDAILATARAHGASLVVLDGFKGMRRLMQSEHEPARFLYSVSAKLALLGMTTVVVTEGDPDEAFVSSEIAVCDVIVALRHEIVGSRRRRVLEVIKSRGSTPLEGVHPFIINGDGLTIFLHFESVVGEVAATFDGNRASMGDPALDALFGGGPSAGTSTLVFGNSGVGKTLLGLQFAAEGARIHEPTLIISLTSSAEQLRVLATAGGIDLPALEATGDLRVVALPSYDLEGDEIAQHLYEDVERRRVRRLVLDSVSQLEQTLARKERQSTFMAALIRYLQSRRVTTYFTLDNHTIAGPELAVSDSAMAVMADNVLLLRSVEYQGYVHYVLSVLKMRFSNHDRGVHEYAISPGKGVHLLGPAPRGDGLLTGIVRPLVTPPGTSPSTDNVDRP